MHFQGRQGAAFALLQKSRQNRQYAWFSCRRKSYPLGSEKAQSFPSQNKLMVLARSSVTRLQLRGSSLHLE